jgi:hypothetical protein
VKLLNPTKIDNTQDYLVTSLPCPSCLTVAQVTITSAQLFAYQVMKDNACVVLKQYDLPTRERFISGFCEKCFNDTFPEDF